MFKQQMALRLNAETEAEAEKVWRSLPPRSRQEIVQNHARLIGHAAKPASLTEEREADDEHAEPSN